MREQPIRIRLLGTAAGGGLPQWNCACANCNAARQGKIPPRTQSGIAISADGEHWILINASPDLRAQIESFPALRPDAAAARNSPVCDVLLTNADFDHVLGLFLLRERREKLRVHCTAAVRETLRDALHLDALLGGYCGVEWHELPGAMTPLGTKGVESGISFRAIPLAGAPPRYATDYAAGPGPEEQLKIQAAIIETLAQSGLSVAPGDITKGEKITRYEILPAKGARVDRIVSLEGNIARATGAGRINIIAPMPRKETIGIEIAHGAALASAGQSVALEFADEKRGIRMVIAPDVAAITPELRAAMEAADAVIFDGTFWSGDELQRIDPGARTASEMGHLPISGGSLEALRGLRARRRVYTHINNTNPILQPGSAERAEVEKAGITIGEDGMEFEV